MGRELLYKIPEDQQNSSIVLWMKFLRGKASGILRGFCSKPLLGCSGTLIIGRPLSCGSISLGSYSGGKKRGDVLLRFAAGVPPFRKVCPAFSFGGEKEVVPLERRRRVPARGLLSAESFTSATPLSKLALSVRFRA